MILENLYSGDLANKNVFYEYESIKDLTIMDMSKIFRDKSVDYVAVTKKGIPFYIFTSTDIIDALVAHGNDIQISTYMDKNPKSVLTFSKNESIFSTYKTIRAYRIHHIVITDDDGQFEVVVTYNDLASFLTEIAIKDDLTGLYNKRFFDFIKDRYQQDDIELGIIFLDLNKFKFVNDTYGHIFGDKVLKRVAEIIKKNIRDIDYAFRFGGDEFVVVTFSDKNMTEKIANRIGSEISKSYISSVQLSSSVGFAHYKSDGKDLDSVLNLADKNMYEVKNSLK